jgi:hypothetical protein
MSAFVCSDRHIATIAVAYCRLTGFDNPAALANHLLTTNIRSVNWRYPNHEPAPIRRCSLEDVAENLSFPDLVALCECLDYQSCELPDYKNPLLEEITALFRSHVHHGVKSALWSI